jgi:hypothetical protein
VTSEVIGILVAGALTLGFALIGEALLGRASRGVIAWNESFLIGAGTAAAILFPLSLVVPHHALDAELGLMVTALLVVAVHRRRLPAAAPPRGRAARSRTARDGVTLLLGAAIFALFAYFCALNRWMSHSWDSVVVFGTRAKLLVVEGGLSRRWFLENAYDNRLLAYPPLISLFEALSSRLRGSFEFDWLKPIFPYFYVSWIVGTYAAARPLVSRRWALGAVLLVALLPEITTHAAAGGYVDMPLAAYVAASTAAALRKGAPEGWRSPLPWLLGSMTAVKQEGMILALVACSAVALFWLSERPLRFLERLRANGSALLVVAAFIAARVGYVRWTHVHDTTWGPFDAAHVERAVRSIGLIVSLCLRYMLDPRIWGLFWPAFLIAAVAVAASGPPRLRLLVVATAACIALEAALFLFTNWDFQVHIEGAYARLLSQLAPAAAVVIVFVASRIWTLQTEKPS